MKISMEQYSVDFVVHSMDFRLKHVTVVVTMENNSVVYAKEAGIFFPS